MADVDPTSFPADAAIAADASDQDQPADRVRGGEVVTWRRVAIPIGFAVLLTTVGARLPLDLEQVFLWPARAVGQLVGFSFGGPRASWLAVWLTVYAQLFFWVLVWEIVRVLWNQLREWESRRAVRV